MITREVISSEMKKARLKYKTGINPADYFADMITRKGDSVCEEDFLTWHPDNIDNQTFWEECYRHFPIETVVSRIDPLADLKYLKRMQLRSQRPSMKAAVDFLKSRTAAAAVEIGAGYGFAMKHMERASGAVWYGIDAVRRFDHPRLYTTSSHVLPEGLPELDLVFSANVFQHFSTLQKKSYFRSIREKLKTKGRFVFDTVLAGNTKCWRTPDNRPAMIFFKQFVEVYQHTAECLNHLVECGLTPIVAPVQTGQIVWSFIAERT